MIISSIVYNKCIKQLKVCDNAYYLCLNLDSYTTTHTERSAVNATSLTDSKDKSHSYLKDRLTHHTLQWWIAT